MSSDLEVMRKAYKLEDEIRHKLINAQEHRIDYDRTWNGKFTLNHCGDFNGQILGHRSEKCIHAGEVCDKELVERFGRGIMNCTEIKQLDIKYIDTQRRNEYNYRTEREAE